jgi:hypothetical protein
VQWSVGQSVGHLVIRTRLCLYLYEHSTASKQVRKFKFLPNERLREYDLLYVPLGRNRSRSTSDRGICLANVLSLCASPLGPDGHASPPYVDPISIHIPTHSQQSSWATASMPKRPKSIIDGNSSSTMDHYILSVFFLFGADVQHM